MRRQMSTHWPRRSIMWRCSQMPAIECSSKQVLLPPSCASYWCGPLISIRERPTAEEFHKHLQVTLSGKKSGILEIPEDVGLVDDTAPTTPNPSKESNSLLLRCPYCAAENNLPANSKGKSVFCQTCGSPFKVLANGQAVVSKEETKAKSKPETKDEFRVEPSRSDNGDDDYRSKKKDRDREEIAVREASLPRRRRRAKGAKGSYWPVLAICAGVCVLALVIFLFGSRGGKSTPSGKQDDSSSDSIALRPSGKSAAVKAKLNEELASAKFVDLGNTRCLQFSERGYVELQKTLGVIELNGSFTVEAWLRFTYKRYKMISVMGDEAWPMMSPAIDVSKTVGWSLALATGRESRQLPDGIQCGNKHDGVVVRSVIPRESP